MEFMPELPEVENIVRDLRPKLCGKKIIGLKMTAQTAIAGHGSVSLAAAKDRTIEEVTRKGKVVIMQLSGGYTLLVHLGMTGQLLYSDKSPEFNRYAELYTRVLIFLNGASELRLADMRRFGWVEVMEGDKALTYIGRLGPDLLTIDLETFKARLSVRKIAIKVILLNQGIVSGLGNIYADESLYRAGIHPCKKGDTLSSEEIKGLYDSIRDVLEEAIRSGGSTIDTYRLPDGNKGRFQDRHRVYQRQGKPCMRCGTKITRMSLRGRGTYFCPRCQEETV